MFHELLGPPVVRADEKMICDLAFGGLSFSIYKVKVIPHLAQMQFRRNAFSNTV